MKKTKETITLKGVINITLIYIFVVALYLVLHHFNEKLDEKRDIMIKNNTFQYINLDHYVVTDTGTCSYLESGRVRYCSITIENSDSEVEHAKYSDTISLGQPLFLYCKTKTKDDSCFLKSKNVESIKTEEYGLFRDRIIRWKEE